ncbi:helix-turn-helix domain-containing protein [Plectonema cf. radiosum LEGE 06105]|uniref:Helix-turn-helix domain-containing protein n=1 Tax=Plectonema cf. radiosum LEGE 06105 TaxID=945769 RepID=A0A8J7F811_9CYAN|nr:helix-turn-helix domain-containing protein [Plectonema radiosum]MBE9216302.1 helix-turn-helix domain-containing protein [Plectonema cf. radiosum LEGE 06105]
MTKHNKARDLARKLYLEGQSTDLIAQKCETSRRTIQRWIQGFDKELVTIKAKGQTSSTEASQEICGAEMSSDDVEVSSNVILNDAEILPTLEKVASLKSSDELDLTVSSRMALHLINLTEKSLLALDDCLTDPDVRTVDKIKAAELVGKWTGLDGGRVVEKILNKFDLTNEGIDAEKSTTVIIPRKLAEAKRKRQELKDDYHEEIYDNFVKNNYFPKLLDKNFFDLERFLSDIECLDMQSEEHNFCERAKIILCERGYENELRELGHID